MTKYFGEHRVLVTSYVSPDLDGFACAIAYAEFLNKTGKPAETVIYGTPHDEALFLIKHFNFSDHYSCDFDLYDEQEPAHLPP